MDLETSTIEIFMSSKSTTLTESMIPPSLALFSSLPSLSFNSIISSLVVNNISSKKLNPVVNLKLQ